MSALSDIKTLDIIHRFYCGVENCGNFNEQNIACFWTPSDHPVCPQLPVGWRMVGYLLICQKHRVEIDGKLML